MNRVKSSMKLKKKKLLRNKENQERCLYFLIVWISVPEECLNYHHMPMMPMVNYFHHIQPQNDDHNHTLQLILNKMLEVEN